MFRKIVLHGTAVSSRSGHGLALRPVGAIRLAGSGDQIEPAPLHLLFEETELALLPHVEDGTLTSSLKMRRKAVYQRLRDKFEALYS